MSFSKITSALSDINFSSIAKKSTSVTDLAKKVDIGDFTSSFTTATTKITKNADEAVEVSTQVSGGIASKLKKFETQPGAAALLSKTAAVMSKNPKLTVLGISTLAASGFVAFQMSQGRTFDEAIGDLLDVVEDAVEDTVEFAAGSTVDVVSGILDAFMKGLFGEDYLTYVKGSAIALLVMIILGIMLKVYSLVKK